MVHNSFIQGMAFAPQSKPLFTGLRLNEAFVSSSAATYSVTNRLSPTSISPRPHISIVRSFKKRACRKSLYCHLIQLRIFLFLLSMGFRCRAFGGFLIPHLRPPASLSKLSPRLGSQCWHLGLGIRISTSAFGGKLSPPPLGTASSSWKGKILLGPSTVHSTRLFGSKHDVPDSPPGEINVYNEQTNLPNLNLEKIERAINQIRKIVGYSTYDVALILTDDHEMREINLETRGVDAPTDILSFPFQEAIEPGNLGPAQFDLPEYYCLGDMIVDVPYVMRRIEEDRKMNELDAGNMKYEKDNDSGCDYVGNDDRGISGAMALEYDAESRITMLLVHGILHLVGYDHIEDEDYERMVKKEEEVLKLLLERLTN